MMRVGQRVVLDTGDGAEMGTLNEIDDDGETVIVLFDNGECEEFEFHQLKWHDGVAGQWWQIRDYL
jgi:hypothetical protein